MAAIDDLMAALSSNAELRQAMTNATSSDDAAKAATAAGYKVTSQEIIEAYKSRMEEMSEDQLSTVAGGKTHDTKSGLENYPRYPGIPNDQSGKTT